MDPLKDEFSSMKTRVAELEKNRNVAPDTALTKKVEDIELQLANLKEHPTPKDGTTALVGGMEGATSAAHAMEWLQTEMAKASIDGVAEVYHKRWR